MYFKITVIKLFNMVLQYLFIIHNSKSNFHLVVYLKLVSMALLLTKFANIAFIRIFFISIVIHVCLLSSQNKHKSPFRHIDFSQFGHLYSKDASLITYKGTQHKLHLVFGSFGIHPNEPIQL